MTERVFLSGFMAAGKTAVGLELANLLGFEFVDLDALIETRSGRQIDEVFASEGEEAFRQLEREALVDASRLAAVVVSLGGGTVTRAENRHLARQCGQVVWLNTPRSTILTRLESGGALRPLYRDREQATELLDARVEFYRDCDFEIRPEAGETPAEIARRIARSLR